MRDKMECAKIIYHKNGIKPFDHPEYWTNLENNEILWQTGQINDNSDFALGSLNREYDKLKENKKIKKYKKIRHKIKDGLCLTDCPYMKNDNFFIIKVGSGYCTNRCYNFKGLTKSGKKVKCSYKYEGFKNG